MRIAIILAPFLAFSLACSSEVESRTNGKKEMKVKPDEEEKKEKGDDEKDESSGDKKKEEEEKKEEEKKKQEEEVHAPEAFKLVGPFGPVNSRPTFTWEKAKGAETYDALLAKDELCADVIQKKEDLKEPAATFENLEKGEAFLCVIAANSRSATAASNSGQRVKIMKGWVSASAAGAPVETRLPSLVWTGKEAYVTGGLPGETFTASSRVFAYEPVADKWREAATAGQAPKANYGAALAFDGKHIWQWVGYTSTESGRFDVTTGTWSAWAGTARPKPAAGETLVAVGDQLITYGSAKKGWIYSSKDDKWEALAPAGPVARTGHCAVTVGEEMLVIGGSVASAEAFKPKSKTWRTLATHTAIKTTNNSPVRCGTNGKDVFVYDGTVASRYDVAADKWTTLDMTGGPEKRHFAAATWVGQAFMVYGGTIKPSDKTPTQVYLYYP